MATALRGYAELAGTATLTFLTLTLLAVPAAGQAFQQHGLNFVTVGDAGSRGATPQEAPLWPSGPWITLFGIMRTDLPPGI